MTSELSQPDLDLRGVRKPQRHPLVHTRFDALGAGESFVLINNHDPQHLRQEFDREHPGNFDWDYLESGPTWQLRITRRFPAELPRRLHDTSLDTAPGPDGGALWALDVTPRQLDANVVRVRPDARIEAHDGPDLDVLVHVLDGSGRLTTAAETIVLTPGTLIWLPRRSRRAISAGPSGLVYLTVHQRRPRLDIGTPAP